jgi:hypothetical protein
MSDASGQPNSDDKRSSPTETEDAAEQGMAGFSELQAQGSRLSQANRRKSFRSTRSSEADRIELAGIKRKQSGTSQNDLRSHKD